MITNFKHKGLRRFYEANDAKGIPPDQAQKLSDILAALDAAEEPEEVGLFSGWRLHPLKGNLRGFWSVNVSGNWRLIFRFENGDARDVDFIDYH